MADHLMGQRMDPALSSFAPGSIYSWPPKLIFWSSIKGGLRYPKM
jgi:hypothetical protein